MAVLALCLSILALAGSVVALRRSARRHVAGAHGPGRGVSAAGSASPPAPAELRAGLATALRHVSVVRYDAYADVTGRQSFTAAILDDNGDGIVITSLHSRTESRTFLKGVEAGRGDGLSPEEEQSVAYASGRRLHGDQRQPEQHRTQQEQAPKEKPQ